MSYAQRIGDGPHALGRVDQNDVDEVVSRRSRQCPTCVER